MCQRESHVDSSRSVGLRSSATLASPACALSGHGQRWRKGNGFRHEVRRDVVALLLQQRGGGLHLRAVRLLGPHADEGHHGRVHRRQCHQRLTHVGIADVDRQSGQTDVEQVGGDLRAQPRAPGVVGVDTPQGQHDFLHGPNLAEDVSARSPRVRRARLTPMRRLRGENGRVSKGLGLRMHLPDNGAVARSLLAVLVLTAAALLWGPAGAATSTAAAGAIAGAIALQDNPLGRIPIVLAVSVELGIAVFAGGLTVRPQHCFRDRGSGLVLLGGDAVGGRCGRRAARGRIGPGVGHPAPAARPRGPGLRRLGRHRGSDAGRSHRGLAAAAMAARARRPEQGVPVAECGREAAGHRGSRGGRFVAAVGVQGSVQRTRGPSPAVARLRTATGTRCRNRSPRR